MRWCLRRRRSIGEWMTIDTLCRLCYRVGLRPSIKWEKLKHKTKEETK